MGKQKRLFAFLSFSLSLLIPSCTIFGLSETATITTDNYLEVGADLFSEFLKSANAYGYKVKVCKIMDQASKDPRLQYLKDQLYLIALLLLLFFFYFLHLKYLLL